MSSVKEATSSACSSNNSSHTTTSPEAAALKYATNLLGTATPALCSGAIQAILFNPFDRALYIRVQQKRRKFLDRRNFQAPFQGFANAAVYRTISSASYIFWQDSCRYFINEINDGFGAEGPSRFTHESNPLLYSAVTGVAAGAANGLALNNMQAVKFQMWSQSSQVLNHWETSAAPSASSSASKTTTAAAVGTVKQPPSAPTAASAAAPPKPPTAAVSIEGLKPPRPIAPKKCLASNAKAFANTAAAATSSSSLHVDAAATAALQQQREKGFFRTAREMYHVGGAKIFFRGVKVTVMRDTVFGFVYEVLRKSSAVRGGLQNAAHAAHVAALAAKGQHYSTAIIEPSNSAGADSSTNNNNSNNSANASSRLSYSAHRRQWKEKHRKTLAAEGDQNKLAFVQNVFAACCGCAASSPLNYVRSLAYGTPYGAVALPVGTLYRYHLREVAYVFRHGHTFSDLVKGLPQPSFYSSEMRRIEDARQRVGMRPLYANGEGRAMLERALAKDRRSLLRRFLLIPAKGAVATEWERRSYFPASQRHFLSAAIHVNRRLNIGWGSLRVGLGMAVGQHVFAMVRQAMEVI